MQKKKKRSQPFGDVKLRSNSHDNIHHIEVKSVQRTDVVENVGVVVNEAQEKHQKIQTPHHLPPKTCP